jgi:hypothetical protein
MSETFIFRKLVLKLACHWERYHRPTEKNRELTYVGNEKITVAGYYVTPLRLRRVEMRPVSGDMSVASICIETVSRLESEYVNAVTTMKPRYLDQLSTHCSYIRCFQYGNSYREHKIRCRIEKLSKEKVKAVQFRVHIPYKTLDCFFFFCQEGTKFITYLQLLVVIHVFKEFILRTSETSVNFYQTSWRPQT